MAEKRHHPGDTENISNGYKRSRSNDGSPAPQSNGRPPSIDKAAIQKQLAEARAKGEAARKANAKANLATASGPQSVQSAVEAARARIEAIKASVAAATPRPSTNSQATASFASQSSDDGFGRARGGLGIGLHPALMGDMGQDKGPKGRQAMQPRFATTIANKRANPLGQKSEKEKFQIDLLGPNMEEVRKNPLYDPNLGGKGSAARERFSRNIIFHQKGKFVQQANALRRQSALEAMKKRIADQARKVGLDEDNEKAFLISEPPEIEWWDEGLVDGKSYEVIGSEKGLKIDSSDSIITIYIQHPVLLEPPQSKNSVAIKPMYLTKTEQAKLRRQRRSAEHKEQQAKIRLGLEPPPPPKVKKSNLMRVLGEQAVKVPTAVEARVNREIAERKSQHTEANEERKLTKEQKIQKLAANQESDAAKGIKMVVFKIRSLAYGKHRYQIDVNAKQNALTGVCVLHPRFNLVIVEGGAHSVNFYKKLMLHRIRWTDIAAPISIKEEANAEPEVDFLKPFDEKGDLKDLTENTCTLLWEGEEKARAFRKWGSKVCESDAEAKEVLSKAKMENFWILAKTSS